MAIYNTNVLGFAGDIDTGTSFTSILPCSATVPVASGVAVSRSTGNSVAAGGDEKFVGISVRPSVSTTGTSTGSVIVLRQGAVRVVAKEDVSSGDPVFADKVTGELYGSQDDTDRVELNAVWDTDVDAGVIGVIYVNIVG